MKKYLFKTVTLVLIVLSIIACVKQDSSMEESDTLYRILVGDKYGFINNEGVIVIEPQYDDASLFFSEGLCYVKSGEKKYIINEKGNCVCEIADTINPIGDFIGGISIVRSCERPPQNTRFFLQVCYYGAINNKGNLILPAIYNSIEINKDGGNTYICVDDYDNRCWFITDESGNVIGSKCDSILAGFCNGLCAIKKNGKWGYIDTKGNLIIDTIYDYVRTFSKEGLARVRKGDEFLFIDKQGNCVISADSIFTGFNKNRAAVMINGEKCLIDRFGNVIRKLKWDDISPSGIYPFADDNLATIIQEGKAAKIDTMGNIVLTTQYIYIGEFNAQIAVAYKNYYECGLIDRDGKEIVTTNNFKWYSNPNNDDMFIFSNYKNGMTCYSYYNNSGKLIWKDIAQKKVKCPTHYPTRADFVEYFDANISHLDPIEGIYYVTTRNYYQDRDNLNAIGLNGTKSAFHAIARLNPEDNEFYSFVIDGSGTWWANKFVRIGESNNYAIVKVDKEHNYSSEGRMTLEDLHLFTFRLETDRNNWYNFFDTYEFMRDYPAVTDCEQYIKAEWTGTGFAIADGYIVTNYHVTNGAKTIRIKGINGDIEKSYKGYTIASDKEHDLSIVKIIDQNFSSLGKIPYGVGNTTVDVGDNIFVLGYPLTSSMGNEIKLTDGVISSLTGYKGDESMFQISAPIQHGNSGGPLFSENGDVVGVVFAKHTEAENASYAIKISYLYRLLESSGYNIDITANNKIRNKKLSSKVKKIKDFVYLIECSSK